MIVARDGNIMHKQSDKPYQNHFYPKIQLCIRITTKIWYFIAAMVYLFSSTPVFSQESIHEDIYKIDIDCSSGNLKVDAILHEFQPSEKICLPAFGQRFGEKFDHLQILGLNDKPMNLSWDPYGCVVFPYYESKLKFHYELSISELPEGHYWQASGLSAYHKGELIAFPGESLFIERGADNSKTASLETIVSVTTVHSKTQVFSSLKHDKSSGTDPSVFRAHHPYELTRSYWTTGMTYMLSSSSGMMSWLIAVAPGWHTGISTVEREFRSILDEYDRMMPGRTPETFTIFLFPADFDANYQHGFARPGGLVVQMGTKSSLDPDSRRVLIAHELFHLYNGESIQYDMSDYVNTAWFREGVTQYIAYHTLLSLGMISKKTLYHWLVLCADHLLQPSQKDTKLSQQEFAYYYGFLMGMVIDNQWSAYHTDYSMKSFFKWLSQSPFWKLRLDNSSILNSLQSYSKFDFNEFFKRYIYQRQNFPIDVLLKNNHLCLYETKRLKYETGIHYRYDPVCARLIADIIEPGSIGEKAGLKSGDILIPSPDMDWQDSSKKQLSVIRDSKRIQMHLPASAEYQMSYDIKACIPVQ